MTERGQAWAQMIHVKANEGEVNALIDLVVASINAGRMKRASLIIACTHLLAQTIVDATDASEEMRGSILALIDGFATELAITKDDE